MPLAARRSSGGAPVQYRVRVANRTAGDLTLQRIAVQSVTTNDAYYVLPTTRPFDVTIPSSEFRDVEMWVPTEMQGNTVAGNNGPVSLRLTLAFKAFTGNFTEVVIRQVQASVTSGDE
jgi:hypothetical protein